LITPASIFGSIISSADMLSPSWNESACSICPLSSSAGHNTVGVRAYGDPQRDTRTQARAHAMNPPAERLLATLPPAAPHAAPATRTGNLDVSGNGSGAPTGRGLTDDFGKVHPGDARVLVIETLPPSLWPRCCANMRHANRLRFVPSSSPELPTVACVVHRRAHEERRTRGRHSSRPFCWRLAGAGARGWRRRLKAVKTGHRRVAQEARH
jgi:hypothetical protein